MGKIVLIDDSQTIKKAVEIALKSRSSDLIWVSKEEEFALVKDLTQVEGVMLDFNFPYGRVYENLKQLRMQFSKVPLVLLCGTLDHPETSELEMLGGIRVLRKPFDRRSLLQALVTDTDAALIPPPPPAPASTIRMKAVPPPPPRPRGDGGALSVQNLDQTVYDELRGSAEELAATTNREIDSGLSTSTIQPPNVQMDESGFSLAPSSTTDSDGFVTLGSVDFHGSSPSLPEASARETSIPSRSSPHHPVLLTDDHWDQIESLVKGRLRDYCSEWVPQNLDRMLRMLIQDEMRQMDDEQWTRILTKALRDVVQEKFLSIAENVVRQELNQLLKEESTKGSALSSHHH